MSKIKAVVYAISTLSGTIIGVGLFGLPYVTLKAGFWVVLVYFFILTAFVILVHSFFAELALKTPDFKRFPGFAEFYLGNWGRNLAYISTILGTFGALLAYLIVGGEFFTELLSSYFGGINLLYTLLYFVIGAGLIFYGIKAIAKVEFWGLILFFLILIAIFFRGQGLIDVKNLFIGISNFEFSASNLFLPYGVILFSLWGAALIPEVEEMLGEKKNLILKIVPIAILIPALVYLFFIYLILGISGSQTTESALGGLKAVLGDGIVALALLFGLLTTFTSFIALGLTLKKVFWYDLKLTKNLAFVITCFVPLFLYLAGLKSFISVIGAVGGIMLAIDGILILLMYNKIRPERKLITYPLILLFLAGILYSIVYFS
jgi:tyrosine-specific transport protein